MTGKLQLLCDGSASWRNKRIALFSLTTLSIDQTYVLNRA